ncbi:MAG: RNA polymerase sigma factor [Mucilaginibacter sp.]
MGILSDNALMLQVKAGDLERMSLLFERHHKALFGFLFHLTQRREVSEDMLQTVFYRMLKYRNSFTEDSNFSGWMYHIARNVLKDHQFGSDSKYAPISEHEEKIGGGVPADESVTKRHLQQQLYDAMGMLNEGDREILILNRIKELKYPEISEIMGISQGAARARVSRAVEELRQLLMKKGLKREDL